MTSIYVYDLVFLVNPFLYAERERERERGRERERERERKVQHIIFIYLEN